MKICSRCGRELDESEFYKNRLNKDGLAYDCKTCRKRYMAIDYAERNKERLKVYLSNPEVKQHIREVEKAYYQENKEQIKAKARKHYQENKEYYKELNRKYQTENRDYYINYEKNYRAKRREIWNKINRI